jgi:RNA 2',3'-cyclic 3'-phosphodiesterase
VPWAAPGQNCRSFVAVLAHVACVWRRPGAYLEPVAKERLGSPRARLFVALELPDWVREALGSWQREALVADPALRAPAAETLHVTLCFLGWLPERRVSEVAAIVGAIERWPIELRFERDPVPVPRRRPRLYAANAPSEGADRLAAEVCRNLEAARLYEPERRPFWSHVTIARVRSERAPAGAGRRRRARPMVTAAAPPPLPKPLTEPFGAVRVTVYRSILRAQGATYVPLASTELPPPGTPEAEKE